MKTVATPNSTSASTSTSTPDPSWWIVGTPFGAAGVDTMSHVVLRAKLAGHLTCPRPDCRLRLCLLDMGHVPGLEGAPVYHQLPKTTRVQPGSNERNNPRHAYDVVDMIGVVGGPLRPAPFATTLPSAITSSSIGPRSNHRWVLDHLVLPTMIPWEAVRRVLQEMGVEGLSSRVWALSWRKRSDKVPINATVRDHQHIEGERAPILPPPPVSVTEPVRPKPADLYPASISSPRLIDRVEADADISLRVVRVSIGRTWGSAVLMGCRTCLFSRGGDKNDNVAAGDGGGDKSDDDNGCFHHHHYHHRDCRHRRVSSKDDPAPLVLVTAAHVVRPHPDRHANHSPVIVHLPQPTTRTSTSATTSTHPKDDHQSVTMLAHTVYMAPTGIDLAVLHVAFPSTTTSKFTPVNAWVSSRWCPGPIPLALSTSGELCRVIGYALFRDTRLAPLITHGVVARGELKSNGSLGHEISHPRMPRCSSLPSVITTARVLPGASGGGLFDTRGQLLGIVVSHVGFQRVSYPHVGWVVGSGTVGLGIRAGERDRGAEMVLEGMVGGRNTARM